MSYVPPAQRAAQAQQQRMQRLQGVDSAQICAALEACLSPQPAAREPAEQLLRDAEGTPGFCTLLLQIATSGEVSPQLQQLAVLAAKNALGRTWQARDPRAPSIGDEEKTALREAVRSCPLSAHFSLMFCSHLAHISLQYRSLWAHFLAQVVSAVCSSAIAGDMALQLALIAAKIARADFPQNWPALLPALAAGLQSTDEVAVFHAVRCLHYVLKEQTSKRLMRDRLDFINTVTPQLLGPLTQMWTTHSSVAIAVRCFLILHSYRSHLCHFLSFLSHISLIFAHTGGHTDRHRWHDFRPLAVPRQMPLTAPPTRLPPKQPQESTGSRSDTGAAGREDRSDVRGGRCGFVCGGS